MISISTRVGLLTYLRSTEVAGCGGVETKLLARVATGLLDHTLKILHLGHL